jgi:hypothetical protein
MSIAGQDWKVHSATEVSQLMGIHLHALGT